MCSNQCFNTSVDPDHCGDCSTQCTSGQVCAQGTCVASSSVPRPLLVVSLTLDDTFADEFSNAAPTLEANGMRATFYVNSSRIDLPGGSYLTTPEILEMQTVGHEIGSHGLMHLHLVTTLFPADRIKREVCDSRVDLLARGFEIRSFAYPFGQNDADVAPMPDNVAESAASQCGYVTARGVGNLDANHGIFAESVPPADPYMLRAASSVNSLVTLGQLEQTVEEAETNQNAADPNPPWLIINFHHICPGAACDPLLAWDTDLFGQFTSWLAARKPQGTIVRTISQVAAGPVNQPVPSGTPLVINGDMESYLGGASAPPDCWTQINASTNTAVWSQVAGRTGLAQQVVISGVGSSTLIQDRGTQAIPDYKSCGTPVIPGHRYTLTCWYQSDVPVGLMVYENDSISHATNQWMRSTAFPASPGVWSQIATDAVIPADGGFNAIYFGAYAAKVCTSNCLNGVNTATLIVDDCSAFDNG